MPLSITGTVDTVSQVVRLVVTGGTPPYVVDASPAGGRDSYRVRSTFGQVSGAPSTRTATDGDVPLNTDVVYVATDNVGAQASSTPVVVSSTTALLSDATRPDSVIPVVVVSQPPNEWEARSVWWDILGATAPFASVAPLRLRSGDVVLRTETPAARGALIALLSSGNPFILRSPHPDAVDDLVALVERVREELVLTDQPTGPRLWTLGYQAVSRQLGVYTDDTGRTYFIVSTEAASYAGLLALYATYSALLLGDPTAGLGVEQITNGSFGSGIVAPWDTSVSANVTWDQLLGGSAYAGAVAHSATAFVQGTAVIFQQPNRAIPAGPKILRVTGTYRTTSNLDTVQVQLVTNKATDGNAQYGQPNAVIVSASLPALSTQLQTFVVDLAVSDLTDDLWTLYVRNDNMDIPPGGAFTLTGLSARWRT